jgi:uroporphyrinogen-III synthase
MAGRTELTGFVVGVTADRRSAEQVLMLERLGLQAVVGPAIRTLPLVDDDGLWDATRALLAEPPDLLVANTGLGIRSWFASAASWGLEEELVATLRAGRVVARGPKAAGAAQLVGLDVWWRPPEERLRAVGDALVQEQIAGSLEGRRVALQLHGDADQHLGCRLREAGAKVIEVPVYRWTLPDDRGPVLRLVERCLRGGVDAITFTAAPALTNLLRIAADAGMAEELRAALAGPVTAACVGPVCADAARAEGIAAPVVPGTWRLGSLVRAVAETLRGRRRALRADGHLLSLQGGAVVLDGTVVPLTDRERSVLSILAERPGAAVPRAALMKAVWGDRTADPHALEAVVGRLRGKLGPAGAAVETVVRRGYRLDARPTDEVP